MIRKRGVFHAPTRLSEAERLKKTVSSAMVNAQSTATELGLDPDMCRGALMAPLLVPQQ